MAKKTNTQINGKDYFRVTATVGKKADGTPIRKQFYGSSKKKAITNPFEVNNSLLILKTPLS